MVVVDTGVRACDPKVERDGDFVCQLRDAPAEDIEEFVQTVCAVSGHKVDWMYVNKYPTIFTTGRVDTVLDVILDGITEFDGLALYRATDKN